MVLWLKITLQYYKKYINLYRGERMMKIQKGYSMVVLVIAITVIIILASSAFAGFNPHFL